MLNTALTIILDEHRSMAAVTHGLRFLVREMSEKAILAANYLKAKLTPLFPKMPAGPCMHEVVVSGEGAFGPGVKTLDVAKRLLDYGFYAPTISFPLIVPEAMMIEPTESEPKEELDRFCDTLIRIREEIREIETGKADRAQNVLKNAPHTAAAVIADDWTMPYSREKAAFPAPWSRARKFWPAVGRVNNPYGDRNLVCTCPPIEAYEGKG